jgi:hypothetical protein
MVKHRSLIVSAASAIIAAATIATTSVLAASAAPRATTEHFQIVQTSATSNTAGVILYGPVTVAGVDMQGSKSDLLKLPGGTFRILHSPGKGSQSLNPKTCLVTINLHGTYTISHGTGAYAGISGSGKYHLSILIVAARSHGACSQKKQPLAFQQIIDASGPIHG